MAISRVLSIIIVFLVVGLGLIINTYLNNRDELTSAVQANEALQLTLNTTISKFELQSNRLDILNLELRQIRTEKDNAYSKLNKYRKHEDVIKKKPEAIERIANAATKRMFNDLCTSTGGDCKSKATVTITSNTASDQVPRNNER